MTPINFYQSLRKLLIAFPVFSPVLANAQTTASPSGNPPILFGRDIAPVLVANCMECHDDTRKRGGLSMMTPAKLTTGGETGPVIQPGKPDESLLVRHIRGDEQPQMPNGRRPLAESTIETIAQWVSAGAKLDDGQSASSTIASLAWTPERMTRDRLSRLSTDDRLKTETAELTRIMAGIRPTQSEDDAKTIATSDHFTAIGFTDPTLRKSLLENLEKARSELLELLKPPSDHPLQNQGRTLLFVFLKPAEFVEFQRQNGFESTDTSTPVIGRLTGSWPIMAILVKPESLEPNTSKKSRSKSVKNKKQSEAEVSYQSADALAVLAWTQSAIESYPKAPAWLKIGLAYVKAREFDRDDSYYISLRNQARELGPRKLSGDWDQRSGLFLKDQLPPQVTLPLSYSLIDWLKSTQPRRFPEFIRDMTSGESVLDATLTKYWNLNRQGFLTNWTAYMLRGSSSSTTYKKGR
jgi:hypothetical protein